MRGKTQWRVQSWGWLVCWLNNQSTLSLGCPSVVSFPSFPCNQRVWMWCRFWESGDLSETGKMLIALLSCFCWQVRSWNHWLPLFLPAGIRHSGTSFLGDKRQRPRNSCFACVTLAEKFSCGGFLIFGSQWRQYVPEVSGSRGSFLNSHLPVWE